ncbi:hypothetical protein HNO89_003883 [Sporosarcina luteola]|nr:hypothetical protein [Sporosarcina luteola]
MAFITTFWRSSGLFGVHHDFSGVRPDILALIWLICRPPDLFGVQ